MTLDDVLARLASMRGQFRFLCGAVRHKTRLTQSGHVCCPMAACDGAPWSNSVAPLAISLKLPIEDARRLARAADFSDRELDAPEQALRRRLLDAVGLEEQP